MKFPNKISNTKQPIFSKVKAAAVEFDMPPIMHGLVTWDDAEFRAKSFAFKNNKLK